MTLKTLGMGIAKVVTKKIKDKIIEGMGQRIAKLNNYIEENI